MLILKEVCAVFSLTLLTYFGPLSAGVMKQVRGGTYWHPQGCFRRSHDNYVWISLLKCP